MISDESDETKAFLTLLSTWDKQELEQKLGQRVEFSKRAIGKLLQAFDRLLQRNEKLHKSIQEKVEKDAKEALEMGPLKKETDIKKESDIKKEKKDIDIKKEDVKTEPDDQQTEDKKMEKGDGDVKPDMEGAGYYIF